MIPWFNWIHALVVTESALIGTGNRGLGIVVTLVAALQVNLQLVVGLITLVAEAALDFGGLKETVVHVMVVEIKDIHG